MEPPLFTADNASTTTRRQRRPRASMEPPLFTADNFQRNPQGLCSIRSLQWSRRYSRRIMAAGRNRFRLISSRFNGAAVIHSG